MDHDMFDCSNCKTNQKRANGCEARPRHRDGTEYSWGFPPDKPEVEIDTCPAHLLEGSLDVVELFRSLNLGGGSVPQGDQQELPQPYIEALSLAAFHQSKKSAHDMAANAEKNRQKSRAKHGR
jgi:hypothetical protein